MLICQATVEIDKPCCAKYGQHSPFKETRVIVVNVCDLLIMTNPVGDLDLCASSCSNISKAKNKEGGVGVGGCVCVGGV